MLNKLTRYEKYILIFLVCGLAGGSLINLLKKKSIGGPFFLPKNELSQPTGKDLENSVKEFKTIDINTASKEDFEKLPGIGPSIASRIIDCRDSKGGFKYTTDLLDVKGIGLKRFSAIKDLLTVR